MSHSGTRSPLQELQLRLTPVRRRLAGNAVMVAGARGLWAGATAALLLAVLMAAGRALGVWPETHLAVLPGCAAWAAMLGLLAGVCLGLRRSPTWLSAAAAIDAHFGLRDAVVAAFQFAERAGDAGLRPMAAMQIAQTLTTLDALDLRAAAQLRVPRRLFGGVLSLTATAALFAWILWLGPPQRTAQRVIQPESSQLWTQEPPVERPAPLSQESVEEVRAAVEWQVAPRAEVHAGHAGPRFDDPLEQAVRKAGEDRPAGQVSSPPTPTPNRVPPEYRPIVRRYFQEK